MQNVIIADDSATARMFVRRCFEIAGLADANIYEADSGDGVLQKLRTQMVDLVISDLNMPLVDGRELVKKLKQSTLLNHIPVIIVSSVTNPALERELTELGALAVLKKPLNPATAAEALEPLLNENN